MKKDNNGLVASSKDNNNSKSLEGSDETPKEEEANKHLRQHYRIYL